MLGQAGQEVAVRPEVGAATHQDDGDLGVGGHRPDLRAPVVESREKGGRVCDLVAKEENVCLAKGQLTGRAGGVGACKKKGKRYL